MSRRKISLKYKKERVVLSDVLPYEIPVTFSNRYFYEFLLLNNIEYKDECIVWNEDDDALDEIVKLIFGIDVGAQIQREQINRFGKIENIKRIIDVTSKKLISIPFGYKISHKENSYRELAICHPKNQLQLIDFYHRFKELILYHCSVSPFSIRRPQKISKYIYHKDRTHYESLSEDRTGIEEHDREYENLRSFFVYKDYSNIYKFYESYKYHRCEKKYNALTRLDITKCFDSIYTHSLSWALLNKRIVKENLKQSDVTFSGLFDRQMQQLNYNETNGIIIGPEFSRIFAELILQAVDRNVAESLNGKHELRHSIDYKIYRYVDDYFIFYNNAADKDKIIEQIQVQLKEYKLYLNENKAVTYGKPIITEITMAKQRIAKLLEDKLVYKLEEIETDKGKKEDVKTKKGTINVNAKTLIVQFKTIIKECGVEYKDIMNYALAVVESKSDKIIKNHHTISIQHRSDKQLIKAIRNILEFVFFIYSVSPRVNTTIKLCRILRIFITYLKGKDTNRDYRHLIFKDIYDNICFVLNKNKYSEYTQVETLYLLVSLSELGKDYWVDKSFLASIFGLKEDGDGNYSCKYSLNYFSITVLLFYMKDKKRFIKIREFIETHIVERFNKNKVNLRNDTELVLLLLDSLTCPHLSQNTKFTLLQNYGITDHNLHEAIIRKVKYWFTKWDNFNLGKELDAKQSQEVY